MDTFIIGVTTGAIIGTAIGVIFTIVIGSILLYWITGQDIELEEEKP